MKFGIMDVDKDTIKNHHDIEVFLSGFYVHPYRYSGVDTASPSFWRLGASVVLFSGEEDVEFSMAEDRFENEMLSLEGNDVLIMRKRVWLR